MQMTIRGVPCTRWATLPKTMPIQEKSASEKVQLEKFSALITGMQIAGRKVMSRPCIKEPNTAPLIPPSALP